jgi:hypothetical protein
MVMRTQMGAVYRADSRDGGRTWSKAASLGVEAPESCPELCKVPGTGDLLLIFNGSKFDPKWPSHFGKRTPLSTAVSTDEGRTWRQAVLGEDLGRYSFRPWSLRVDLAPGAHAIRVRATNRIGQTQPLDPLWNPAGYMRNVVETTRVQAA